MGIRFATLTFFSSTTQKRKGGTMSTPNNSGKGPCSAIGSVVGGIVAAVAVFVMVFGTGLSCGPSKDDMESEVKSSLQELLNTNPQFKGYSMTVKKVDLIKSSKTTYDGFATVVLGGNDYSVPLLVRVDGAEFMWEAKDGAFNFLQ
jgi:hypothetical protein